MENVLAANKARVGLKYLESKALGYFLLLMPILVTTVALLLILPDEYGSMSHWVLSVIIGMIAVIVFMLGTHIAFYKSYRYDPRTTWASFIQRYSNTEKHPNDDKALDVINAVDTLKMYNSSDPTFKLAAMLDLILFRDINPSEITRYVDELQKIASVSERIDWILRESVQAKLQQGFLIAELDLKFKGKEPFDPIFSTLVELIYGSDIFTFNRISVTIEDKS